MQDMKELINPTQEELFDLWCEELIQAGYIKEVRTTEDYSWIPLFEGLYRTKEVEEVLYEGTSREKIRTKKVRKTLLKPIKYKPDRVIFWEKKSRNIFFGPTFEYHNCYFGGHLDDSTGVWVSPVEVKAPPGYGGSNTSDASFRVKQKWVWEKIGVLVNKVYNYPIGKTKVIDKVTKAKSYKLKAVTPYLWTSTFTPERFFLTNKTFKPRSITNWNARSLQEFLNIKNPTK